MFSSFAPYRNDPKIRLANTPFSKREVLSSLLDLSVFVKDESRSPVGSFKGRGTWEFVEAEKGTRALICASAGNFGIGLAYSAHFLRRSCTVVVPQGAAQVKVARATALGAEVLVHGRDFDEAKEFARNLAGIRDVAFVEDGAHPAFERGAHRLGMEIFGAGPRLDVVFVPVGNGALINGIARACRELSPETSIIGVCAASAPAMMLSFKNSVVQCTPDAQTIADGIAVRVPIESALRSMRELVDDVIAVTEDQIKEALLLYLSAGYDYVEPAAATPLAALRVLRPLFERKRAALVLTGGNIDPDLRSRVFAWGIERGGNRALEDLIKKEVQRSSTSLLPGSSLSGAETFNFKLPRLGDGDYDN